MFFQNCVSEGLPYFQLDLWSVHRWSYQRLPFWLCTTSKWDSSFGCGGTHRCRSCQRCSVRLARLPTAPPAGVNNLKPCPSIPLEEPPRIWKIDNKKGQAVSLCKGKLPWPCRNPSYKVYRVFRRINRSFGIISMSDRVLDNSRFPSKLKNAGKDKDQQAEQ